MISPEGSIEDNEKYISTWQNLPRVTSLFGRESFSKEVACLLFGMGMEKYIDIFKNNNISLAVFLTLTEDDLRILGIEDENDCTSIVLHNNLGSKISGTEKNPSAVSTNPSDDLLIASNLQSHCTSLNSSLSLLLRKLNNTNLTDYYACKDYCAKELLSIVCAKATQQSEINAKLIHGSNGLIEAILMRENIQLPSSLKSQLKGTRVIRKKRIALLILAASGMCSLAVLANIYLR